MRFILAPTSSYPSENPTVRQSTLQVRPPSMNVITNNDNLTKKWSLIDNKGRRSCYPFLA